MIENICGVRIPSDRPMVATTISHDEGGASSPSWHRYLALLADALRTPEPAVLPPR